MNEGYAEAAEEPVALVGVLLLSRVVCGGAERVGTAGVDVDLGPLVEPYGCEGDSRRPSR